MPDGDGASEILNFKTEYIAQYTFIRNSERRNKVSVEGVELLSCFLKLVRAKEVIIMESYN